MGQIGQTDTGDQSDDGLDAIFLWFDQRDRKLTYAGAHMPLHVLRVSGETVTTHETDRIGVGYVATPTDYRWQNRSIMLQSQDLLFAATDGLTDQIGGSRHIAFGKRRLRELIVGERNSPASEQVTAIMQAHRDYQSWHRRRDDLSLFCLRVQ